MAQMNPGTIYFKTEQGRLEINARSGRIDALQRRLLIMVDGKKAVNDLAAFVRVGELQATLEHLLVLGLIESDLQEVDLLLPLEPGYAAARPSEAPRPATSPEEFAKVRDDASRYVAQHLGTSGSPICEAIDRCKSPEELRRLLRGVEAFVGDKLNAATAHEIATDFGRLLM